LRGRTPIVPNIVLDRRPAGQEDDTGPIKVASPDRLALVRRTHPPGHRAKTPPTAAIHQLSDAARVIANKAMLSPQTITQRQSLGLGSCGVISGGGLCGDLRADRRLQHRDRLRDVSARSAHPASCATSRFAAGAFVIASTRRARSSRSAMSSTKEEGRGELREKGKKESQALTSMRTTPASVRRRP
jgi:hypothetical protein